MLRSEAHTNMPKAEWPPSVVRRGPRFVCPKSILPATPATPVPARCRHGPELPKIPEHIERTAAPEAPRQSIDRRLAFPSTPYRYPTNLKFLFRPVESFRAPGSGAANDRNTRPASGTSLGTRARLAARNGSPIGRPAIATRSGSPRTERAARSNRREGRPRSSTPRE